MDNFGLSDRICEMDESDLYNTILDTEMDNESFDAAKIDLVSLKKNFLSQLCSYTLVHCMVCTALVNYRSGKFVDAYFILKYYLEAGKGQVFCPVLLLYLISSPLSF